MYYLLTKYAVGCTQALQLLYGLDIDEPLELTVVDIESDADLQQEYGWLVPVLKTNRIMSCAGRLIRDNAGVYQFMNLYGFRTHS